MHFVVYEGLQDLARRRSGHITSTSKICAGGMAGIVFWTLSVPFDAAVSLA